MADESNSPGHERLMEILAKAVAVEADCVEFEYDSGHCLEVTFMSGNSGGGFSLPSELGGEVMDAIYEGRKKSRSGIRFTLDGTNYSAKVERYESFGETCYRLTVRKARR
jgi:hypothetical protein